MTPTLLALGANVGDRHATLRAAVAGLGRFLNVTAVSSLYETAPMYILDQDRFLNLVVVAETALPPRRLLIAIKELEHRLGRTPARRYGPRQIDIDIVFHGDAVVREADLEIPHPRLAERAFVLAPAAEVAGDWPHPVTGRTTAEMLDALGALRGIEKLSSDADTAPPTYATG